MNWNLIEKNARKVLNELDMQSFTYSPHLWYESIVLYNNNRSRNARISIKSGISRIALIIPCRNYVIKIQQPNHIGGKNFCSENEETAYTQAVEKGIEKYFIQAHHFMYYGHYIQIMEKVRPAHTIKGYEDMNLCCTNFIPNKDKDKVFALFQDDHSGNWGFDKEGNVKIFDYTV